MIVLALHPAVTAIIVYACVVIVGLAAGYIRARFW